MVVGSLAGEVGKSALTIMFIDNFFSEEYGPNVGACCALIEFSSSFCFVSLDVV